MSESAGAAFALSAGVADVRLPADTDGWKLRSQQNRRQDQQPQVNQMFLHIFLLVALGLIK